MTVHSTTKKEKRTLILSRKPQKHEDVVNCYINSQANQVAPKTTKQRKCAKKAVNA